MKVLKSAIPNVGYVKIERDCPYNKQVGTLRRIKIYDFNVMDDGKHVATFMSRGMNRNYHLSDLNGKSVNIVGSIRLYIAIGRGFFDYVYSEAKQANAIPLPSVKDDYVDWQKLGDEVTKEHRKREKAEEMFDILYDIRYQQSSLDSAQRILDVVNYVEGS